MTAVVWLSYNPESICRGYWDQQIIEDLLSGDLWKPPGWRAPTHHELLDPPDGWAQRFDRAVVVLPARHNATHVDRLIADLAQLDAVLLVLTGDEDCEFPADKIHHPNMVVWQQDPPLDAPVDRRPFGSGYTPHMAARGPRDAPADERTWAWSFAGQITHLRRQELDVQLRRMGAGGFYQPTEGFTQGMAPDAYVDLLLDTRIAPCPSGPVCPDSFRVYEALEAGCYPVVDVGPHHRRMRDHWYQVCWGEPPFPVLETWAELPGIVSQVSWPTDANRVGSWWQAHKVKMARALVADLDGLGFPRDPESLADKTTVVVTTSPAPLHPSIEHLDETVRSVTERFDGCEVWVLADGVRPEQDQFTERYERYLARVFEAARVDWSNVTVGRFDSWRHQAGLTRWALKHAVTTPTLVFVEHDTPLIGDLPAEALVDTVCSGRYDLVRLHHEASVLDDHLHLMIGEGPEGDPPIWPTVQWSQRPHIASTAYYTDQLFSHFTDGSRTMVEDTMHSVVQSAYIDHGLTGWHRHRLGVYCPPDLPDQTPGIKRSTHLDSREDAPKYGMIK